MKKFLVLLAFLPFVSFGSFVTVDGFRVIETYLYTWTGYNSTLDDTRTPRYSVNSEDQFYSVYASGTWGFRLNLRRTSSQGMNYSLVVPSYRFPSSVVDFSDITNSVYVSSNGVYSFYSPLVVSTRVQALYQSAAVLFSEGYRGPAVTWYSSGNNYSVNVNYPLLLSDVLSSTNTLYRQILLGYLSSIQSSVASIDSGVSALAPVLSDIRDINSSISSNTASVAASSSLIADNTASVAQSSSLMASNTAAIVESSSNMASNTAAVVQSSALMASNTASIVQSSALAASNTVAIAQTSAFAASNTAAIAESSSFMASNTTAIAESSSNMASNTAVIAESSSLMASNTTAIAESSSNISSNTASIAESSSLMASNTTAIAESSSNMASNTASVAESSKAISDNTSSLPESLDKIFNQVYDSHGMIGNISSELDSEITPLISYISAALSGDPSKLPPNNPYFPYDPNDPTDPNHPSNPNSPLNPNSPNSLTGGGGLGAFTTNQVMRPITNALDDASQAIQSNATSNADSIRENDDRNWQNFMDQATGDGAGLNVRITYPIAGQDMQAVNVYDYGVIGAIENNWRPLLDELKNFSDNFVAYMQGGVDVNLPSNLFDDVISPLYDLTNRPSYLLLDDYADYISNGVYSASVSAFITDFPGVYSNLLHYGLVSDGSGNFWTLFGANLLYQSGLIGSLLNDMALVRSFCDEHMDGGLSGGVSNITSRLPSPTELEDWLNTYTGRVSEIELASTNLVAALQTVTNYSHSVFSPFEGSFDSISDLVLFKLPGEHYVTVPVSERMDVWRLLRYGIAFALCAVNFILFPKFVLMLVVLFSKLSTRFVKFLPTDR